MSSEMGGGLDVPRPPPLPTEAPPESDEATHAEVLAYLGPVVERVVIALVGEGTDPEAVQRALATLSGDAGALSLLAAAYDEGRAEAARAVLREGSAAPDFSDVDSGGERRLIVAETSACSTCSHAHICVVPRSIPTPLLVVIQRCTAHETVR